MSTYRVRFTIECMPQDDFAHFQPDTVTARIPGTSAAAVGDNAEEAVMMLVRFLAQGFYKDDASGIVHAVTFEAVD